MNAAGPASQGERCPVCGKPTGAHVKPFCSSRCRNVDLNRWLKGSYAIPADDDGDEADNAPSIAPDVDEERR